MSLQSELAERVVFVDADNTLWDTNQVYADAQLALLSDVEAAVGERATADDRLAWIRQIDQSVAERHHAGLRYPPRLLAKAVSLALRGEEIPVAARFAWSGGRSQAQLDEVTAIRIEQAFIDRLNVPPNLREGVREGLNALHSADCLIMVLTEGGRDRVLALLRHHELDAYVTRVIDAPKQRQIFDRARTRAGTSARAFMIGDQLDRDIVPAKAAGLTTIFFPGGFQPKWQATEDAVVPDKRVRSFEEAASFILGTLPTTTRHTS